MIRNQKYFVKTLIAQGKPPVSATNGYIKLHFEHGNKPQFEPDARGKINFKELNIIKSVSKGALLAEKIEPRPGELGKNLFGMDIPFEVGIPGEWKIGPNCELTPDGKQLISKIDGRPLIDRSGAIRVDEVILLENVDYSTGNIDFPGTIVVEGTVADNFTLKTKGSLFIKKSVGRVFLYAEKDIVLSGGIMGRNGGFIEAGGDLYTKFVEQGNLKAGGSIFIEEASLHSTLVAGDGIVIQGGRGELIGGEAIAANYISVSKLGAVVETKTNIIVGLPPNILDELRRMKEEISHKEDLLKKIRQSLQKINDKLAVHKDLSKEEKEMLKKLLELEKKYIDLTTNVRVQYESIISSYDSKESAYIYAEKFIYPRVNISFGKGKQFNSELRTLEGKVYVYIGVDGLPTETKTPPKNQHKIDEIQRPSSPTNPQ
jgi:uncharacterized protein (DUF342 family)